MSEQLRKRLEEAPPVAFRASSVSRKQLDELMALWGENQSQAVIRSIERAWWIEVGSKQDGTAVPRRPVGRPPKRRLTKMSTKKTVVSE